MAPKAFLVSCMSLLLIYTPVAPGATPLVVGQMTTRGSAEINGTPAPARSTVFAGDRISTAAETTAALALSGGDQVLFPGQSAARVEKKDTRVTVSLERGALAVLSKSGAPMTIEAIGTRIHPTTASGAVFEVVILGNSLKVFSRAGTTTVESAGRTVEVKEGNELEATMARPSPQYQTGLSTFEWWTLITAVGAGATGLILGVVTYLRPNPKDCSLSPSTQKIVCP